MENDVRIENLCQSYGKGIVLDRLSLNLPGGSIVGLMGPNGCGKSTLLKILAGLLTDYTGSISICGEPLSAASRAHVSYLPDKNIWEKNIKPLQAILYYADFFEDFDPYKAEDLMSKFGLDLQQPFGTMSKGMQEKMQIALCMSRHAKLYLLDEPLGGVDPATRYQILKMIQSSYLEDSTLVVATHLVKDLEPFFNYGVLLGFRELVLAGSVEDIQKTYNKSFNDIFQEVFACSASF